MTDDAKNNERERIAAIPQLCFNGNLRKVSRIVSRFYDENFRATGLHANQVVLLIPPYLLTSVSINDMAEHVGLDRTSLSRNLKPLEMRGLIMIEQGEDARTRLVTLTDAGHEILLTALPMWEEAQQQIKALLGSQSAELMSILADLADLEK